MLWYACFGVLALWAGLVLVRFFQEHPLSPGHVWQLVRTFYLPPPSGGISKLAAILRHLFLVFLLTVAGVLAGRRLLMPAGLVRADDPSRGKWDVAQDLLLALGLGWGLLMYITFSLGVLGGLYAAAMWVVLLLPFVVCYRDFPALLRDIRTLFSFDRSERRSPVALAGLPLVGVMLFLLAIIALAPSITHDAMVYHLNVPRIYATEHRIVAVPYNLFSNTVLNLEMLYTAALLIDDFILANLIHYVLGVGALLFLYAFAKRNLGGATAALAVLIFFFNPPVLNEMPIAYVDMGMVFYFLLALSCLWRWRTENDERWFVLLCIFAGVSAGIKYTSLHGLVSIGAMIVAAELFSDDRNLGRTVERLALFGGVVVVFVSPYLVKNYVITGNPIYPLMYDVFGGRWLVPRHVERMLAYVHTHGMGHDVRSLVALPWNITILGKAGFANFDTKITPLWLILLPAYLFIRQKPALLKWAAAVCVVYFVSWAASTHITRYLMPIFPLLSLLCAHAIVTLTEEAGQLSRPFSVIVKAAALSACGLVWFSFAYFYPLLVPSQFGPVVWGAQTRDEFLAEKVPNYAVFKYINENLPPDARLVFFWDNRGFFCNRPQIGDSVFEAPSMIELVHQAGSAEAFRKKLIRMGVTHILVNELFLARFPPFSVSAEDEARLADDFSVLEGFLTAYCIPLFSSDGATLYALRR